MPNSCRLCGEDTLSLLLDHGKQPVATHLLSDPAQEEFLNPLVVRFCEHCGLIQTGNPVSMPDIYISFPYLSGEHNHPHLPRMLELIGEMPDLTNSSKIVEVGSNDGSFLARLRDAGYTNLLGVEAAPHAQEAARRRGVPTFEGLFSPASAKEIVDRQGQCDLLVILSVLEHVPDLEPFAEAMMSVLKPGGYVLIEVPDIGFSLTAPDYSAIWEDAPNYFNLETVTRFLGRAAVEVTHSEPVLYAGQALLLVGNTTGEAQAAPTDYMESVKAHAYAYCDRWPRFREALLDYAREQTAAGKKLAVYGAGNRAVTLINLVGMAPYLDFVVDDQPEKQGKYMPGSRLPILPSDALQEYRVDMCLLAVTVENEAIVVARHQAYQQRGGLFASVLPPSSRLLPLWNDV